MEEISIQEALALAKIREENAKLFYETATQKVELLSAKKFLTELAKEEEQHIKMIALLEEKINRDNKVPNVQHHAQNMGSILNDTKIELDNDSDFLDILKSAIEREKEAINEYSTFSSSIEDGEVKDLFKLLTNEEKKHLKKFEEDYDDFTDEMSHEKVRALIAKMIK